MPTAATSFATDAQMAKFWTYRTDAPTPSLGDALAVGAIAPGTPDAQWHALTPGMRREIVRSHVKRGAL